MCIVVRKWVFDWIYFKVFVFLVVFRLFSLLFNQNQRLLCVCATFLCTFPLSFVCENDMESDVMHCIKKRHFSQWKTMWFYENVTEIQRKHFKSPIFTVFTTFKQRINWWKLNLTRIFCFELHKMVFAILVPLLRVSLCFGFWRRTDSRQLIQNNTRTKQT